MTASRELTVRTWTDVLEALRRRPELRMVIDEGELPSPASAGAVRSIGVPAGQSEDWRFPPEADGSGVHVRRHGDQWIAHLDRVHPDRDLPGHLMRDAPTAWVVGTMLGAGGLTYAATRKPVLAFAVTALAYLAAVVMASHARQR